MTSDEWLRQSELCARFNRHMKRIGHPARVYDYGHSVGRYMRTPDGPRMVTEQCEPTIPSMIAAARAWAAKTGWKPSKHV